MNDNNNKEDDSLEANNIYYFCDNFSNATTKPVIEFIIRKNMLPEHKKPEFLQLVINSPGGGVASALALIDVMKGSAIPVHTLGLGLIASCGVLTFMSGVKGHRILTPNTSILSHQFSSGSFGKEHELFSAVKRHEMTSEQIMTHYKKCTGLTEEVIREKLLPESDKWLTAKEAVELGIADSIKEVY